jgi:hypothetical protein
VSDIISTPTPDPPHTGEGIDKRLSELEVKISTLTKTITDFPEELSKKYTTTSKTTTPSNTPAIIAAAASIIAAVASFFSGWMTSNTNTALTRITTLQSEIAKKDKDIYFEARDQIATFERAFETFLFTKHMDLENDPFQSASDLDKMVNAKSFGSYTSTIRDFNDFVGRTIATLQKNPDRWKDADSLRQEAQKRQQKALEALDHWLWDKK